MRSFYKLTMLICIGAIGYQVGIRSMRKSERKMMEKFAEIIEQAHHEESQDQEETGK